jgi:hypothetical protein
VCYRRGDGGPEQAGRDRVGRFGRTGARARQPRVGNAAVLNIGTATGTVADGGALTAETARRRSPKRGLRCARRAWPCSLSTACRVSLAFWPVLKRTITWPRGETADDIFTVSNARPLEQALQHATAEMLRWLGDDYGLEPRAASHLMGQVVRYDVGNVFNPAFTVACRIAKRWLMKHGGRPSA